MRLKNSTYSDWEKRMEQLRKSYRNYRPCITTHLCINKVWNNGMGSLALCLADPDKGVIFVNKCLATKRDFEKIGAAFPELKIVAVEYGYPDYYDKCFARACREHYEANN